MRKPLTPAQKRRAAIRIKAWQQANPERARASKAKWRAANPITPETRARNTEINRAWRAKNAAKLKSYNKRRWQAKGEAVNAQRRAQHAADPAKNRARNAAWKAAHPGDNRVFYHRHREKFTGNGPWSDRSKRIKRAWRKFTDTCAANRAKTKPQEQISC